MNLFQSGAFTLHSGNTASWKIDCDALTDSDWDTIAEIVRRRYGFSEVHGVPRGGMKLAERLQDKANASKGNRNSLIVDDVYTTGNSMRRMRDELILRPEGGGRSYVGVVLFARAALNPADRWIAPIFQWWS